MIACVENAIDDLEELLYQCQQRHNWCRSCRSQKKCRMLWDKVCDIESELTYQKNDFAEKFMALEREGNYYGRY